MTTPASVWSDPAKKSRREMIKSVWPELHAALGGEPGVDSAPTVKCLVGNVPDLNGGRYDPCGRPSVVRIVGTGVPACQRHAAGRATAPLNRQETRA